MERALTAAVVFCFLLCTDAVAQTGNATLGGTVSDPSRALMPGVTITATNVSTGIVNTVLSNEAGAYQFASLQPGTYRVSAELPSFQTQTYSDVVLGLSQQVRLNFTLQVGGVTDAIEVTVAADTLIATTSSSVGTVLTENMVRDLPLGSRNIIDLIANTGGTGPRGLARGATLGNFAGGRQGAVNTTRDGFVVSDGRFIHGAYSGTYVSPDLVEEVRVITSSVDAEAARGSGQVQMSTRSGTNQFRGSVFWANRNSALDSSNWFNNFNNVKKDFENRNQFGARLGGPIIPNKTFFFVLAEGQRNVIRQTYVGDVLTEQARNGIFRFFPGVDNGNITSNSPTVDRNGNPVKPAGATGDLQSFSVFGRDPVRTGYDPSGFVQNVLLSRMPLPNDYTVGDGLNTAGIRFTRRIYGTDFGCCGQAFNDSNRDQFNMRLDHNFNANHKLFVVYTWERNPNMTDQAGIPTWPGGYYGENHRKPSLFTTSLVSTLSSNVVNELRVGYNMTSQLSWGPYYTGRGFDGHGELTPQAKEVFNLLPKANGIPVNPNTTLFPNNVINVGTNHSGVSRWSFSPTHSYGDTISWTKGNHAFKAGGEIRFAKTAGGNDTNMTPMVQFGAGGVPVANIDNLVIPGLHSNNQTRARNLLIDLSGSLEWIRQAFDIVDPFKPEWKGYSDGVTMKVRDARTTDFSGFFKDSWKAHRDLTLNIGVQWEYYGVPYDAAGLMAGVVGGEKGLCGIACGSLTMPQFVGKHSPNPDTQLHKDDWNNFGPNVGLSWSLPWLGGGTVLRAGYGVSYAGGGLKNANTIVNQVGGSVPGTLQGSTNVGITYTQPGYLSLANMKLPIPFQYAPLAPVALNGSRDDIMQIYSDDRPTPYIQNFNLSLQREVAKTLTLNVSYTGSKGTKLWNAVDINSVDIFSTGILDAFEITRAGGNATLFDRMLNGLNIPGAGVVNGTTVRGSAALRAYTATRAFIANGRVGALADFLNRSTAITGQGGGFVRNSGLFPENFIVPNPQFNAIRVHGNPSNSTYHSLQVQATNRLSSGFTNQTTYIWSRALGLSSGDGNLTPRDPNNRSLDKSLLSYHRTHSFTSTGTAQLPFGPNRALLAGAPSWVHRVVEQWQFGGIFKWDSGAPLTITAPLATIWQGTTNTPVVLGELPKGKVTREPGNVPTYFAGLQQVTDSARNGVTTLQGAQGAFNLRAIADSQGRLLLENPAPGQAGTLGLNTIEGPSMLTVDANLLKRVRISESKEFEFRLDVVNVLNRTNFGDPNLNINSPSFGRITSSGEGRRMTLNLRLNF